MRRLCAWGDNDADDYGNGRGVDGVALQYWTWRCDYDWLRAYYNDDVITTTTPVNEDHTSDATDDTTETT